MHGGHGGGHAQMDHGSHSTMMSETDIHDMSQMDHDMSNMDHSIHDMDMEHDPDMGHNTDDDTASMRHAH